MKRAGYDATGLNVYFGEWTSIGAMMHSVCILKMKDLYYKVGDTNKPGSVDDSGGAPAILNFDCVADGKEEMIQDIERR